MIITRARIATLLIWILVLLSATPANAFFSSSTSFTVPISELISISGSATSTTFGLQSAGGQQATGISTSTSFNIFSGILYSLFSSAAPAAPITVAGTVFSNDGITTTTSSVSISVNGGTKTTTSTDSGGAYIFTSITQPTAGDVITVWMDNAGAGNGSGAVVTRYNSGNISGLDIYKNQFIARHEDSGPLVNTDIDACTKTLGAGCADNDLHFDVSGGALTIDNDWGLYLWGGDTFTPGGAVTLSNGAAASASGGDVKWASSTSVLAMGANALSVGGDILNDAAGDLTSGSAQVVTFTATTTGFRINPGGAVLRNVVFNGSGGGWSPATSTMVIGSTAASSSGNLTMTAGTLDNSNGTSSVTVHNGSVTGAGGIINLTSATFTMQLFSTSTANFGSTNGNWTFNRLIFTVATGTAGTYTFTTQTAGSGDITVNEKLDVQAGSSAGVNTTLNAGNRTWTLLGTDGAPFLLTNNSGTADLNSASSTFSYAANNAGGNTTIRAETYWDLAFTNNPGETFVFSGDTTTNNDFTMSGVSDTIDTTGATFTVNGQYGHNSGVISGTGNIIAKGAITMGATAVTNLTGGTFEHRVSTSTTMLVQPVLVASTTFYNLKMNNTGAALATTTLTVSGANRGFIVSNDWTIGDNSSSTYSFAVGAITPSLRSTNDLIISTSGQLNASTSAIQVGRDFTATGTFNPNSSTVTFVIGSATSTITGSSTELSFYNLSATTANKALVFGTSTPSFRINGALTLTGTAGNPVRLDSNSSGTQWLINHQGTESVDYVSLHDSGCVATSTFITSTNATDRGNNGTCWFAATGISVSGTVFSDEGITTTTSTVKLAVGSSTSYTTSTNASGVYTFTGVTQPTTSTILTVWMDNAGAGNGSGAAVTRYIGGGDVTGLDVYKNYLITRHEDSGPLTNVDMSLCDKTTGSACTDADLHFDVSGAFDSLTVDNDWGLYLWGGDTFTPSGTVTLANGAAAAAKGGDIFWASSTSVINLAANALSVGGDWHNNASGTLTVTAGQTTTFTATTTGYTITRPGTFENLTLSGSGGGWTFATSGAVIALDLSVATGTLNINTQTLDVNGNLSIGTNGTFQASTTFTIAKNFTNSGTFSVGSSTVIFDTTATSTILSTSTTAFWNFTSQTGAKPFVFGANQTFRVNGQLMMTGTAGNLISIDSTASGTQWLMNHQGTEVISYTTIKDSGCVSTSTYISVNYANSVDRGNNAFCWAFPSLSFTMSPLSVSLSLGDTNTFTSSATNTLTVSTNGEFGYNVTAYETELMTRISATTTMANWTGTNATPTTWTTTCIASATCGFGYSTDDTDLTQFSSTKFAGFTTSTPGDVVATASTRASNESTVMTYRASVDLSQAAGDYQTTVRYIVTPAF